MLPVMGESDLRRRFFDAAHEILASDGYGALKQSAVCQRLGVTTGAFYHAFRNWEAFTEALLTDWHQERTTVHAQFARAQDDPIKQLRSLSEAGVTLRHKSEGAIRVWAGVDPRVAEVQRAVDEERYGVLRDAFYRLLDDRKEAARFAAWGMNILTGFEQMPYLQTTADLRWQFRMLLELACARATVF
jgi:AcrR family transcriptional regulator